MKDNRRIGKCGIQARPIPLGCWAMGGPFMRISNNDGYATVDDGESKRTIHRAANVGANFFTIG